MPFNQFNNKYSHFKVQLKKAYSNIEITGYSDNLYCYFKYCKSIYIYIYYINCTLLVCILVYKYLGSVKLHF